MDIYAVLEVHTTNTITEGRHTVQAFTALIQVCTLYSFIDSCILTHHQQYITQAADNNEKNWNFPKLHMITHIFDEIKVKGASCNYNTKLNEQMHGPLKDWYLNQTNFKNVAEQVMCQWFLSKSFPTHHLVLYLQILCIDHSSLALHILTVSSSRHNKASSLDA
jgi:hypothetical protein